MTIDLKGLPGRPALRRVALACALVLSATIAPRAGFAQRGGDAADTTKPGTVKAGTAAAPAGAGTGSAADAVPGEDDALYKCGKAKGQVSVSFKADIELKDLITWAMGFTCKNFIYSAEIGGRTAKVTIIAPKKMSPQEAYRVFLVALTTMHLAVVPKGNVLKVVEEAQAKGEAVPVYRKGGVPNDDEIVRMILRPTQINVSDLAVALEVLKSQNGVITVLPANGVLLITDHGSHLQSMVTLTRELDVPVAGERIYMIKVNYADAKELADRLVEILGVQNAPGATPTGTPPSRPRRGAANADKPEAAPIPVASVAEVETAIPKKILSDERTNSLIVLSSEAGYLRVRALAKRLDVPVDVDGGGHIHVYYLENAQAEEMAATLNAVITGIAQPTAGAAGGAANNRGGRQAPQAATPPPPQTTGAREGSGVSFEGTVRVTHDAPTNALVVVASAKDFLALSEVVRKLDMPRRQVFIEAVILEVNADNSLNLGTSFHGGYQTDNGSLLLGGLQQSTLSSVDLRTALQPGLIGGIAGPLLAGSEELLGISIPSYGVLFQALANTSNVNVLSSPHLLTTDNEQAEISVGENIPYQSQLAGSPGGAFAGVGPSIQRQDVALTLKIKPHVNASEMVRLEIDQEISNIKSKNFEGLGPSWSKRTIKTQVVVRDQQSIVIGGLVSDTNIVTESKIPLLGDIPILGYLFKFTTKSKAKTNLLILLTPYIIKDQMDIDHIVQRKVRERAEFMRSFSNFNRSGFLPDVDFGRKRGLVEEINHQVHIVERERELLDELERKGSSQPDGPIEYEGADDAPVDDTEPTVAPDGDTAAAPTTPAPTTPAPTAPATTPGGQ